MFVTHLSRVFRTLGVGALALVWLGLRPAQAVAQVVEIFPGTGIQTVVNAYAPGTTFRLKAGVHRLQTIRPRNGDRFVGEPGTVLSGARQLTTFRQSGSLWVAGGQTQEGIITTLTFVGSQLVQVRLVPTVVLDDAQPNLTDPSTDGRFVLHQVLSVSTLLDR